jgi:hypothetical protein
MTGGQKMGAEYLFLSYRAECSAVKKRESNR